MEARPAGVSVRVRVTPRAGRDALAGWQGDVLRVRLAAAPVDGQANEALVRLLAALLDVPRSALQITHGAAAREKRLRILGLDAETVQRRLSRPAN